MKKLLALCTVAIPLVMAVPASAAHAERSTNFEDVLRALVLSQFGGEARPQARGRSQGHERTWRDERQIIPIGRLVRQIQRETRICRHRQDGAGRTRPGVVYRVQRFFVCCDDIACGGRFDEWAHNCGRTAKRTQSRIASLIGCALKVVLVFIPLFQI